ncbi:hypothetical protein ACWDSD_34820 [Streptomyces spiralis]
MKDEIELLPGRLRAVRRVDVDTVAIHAARQPGVGLMIGVLADGSASRAAEEHLPQLGPSRPEFQVSGVRGSMPG